jgi:hypothetical protein
MRKLIGKLGGHTSTDCKSEARRPQLNYENALPVPAPESNAFRGVLTVVIVTCIAQPDSPWFGLASNIR